jgi:hypothetical protein
MYSQIDKAKVLTELNNGSELYCVDFRTLRVMSCSDMTVSAVKSFMANENVLFFKRSVNE